MEVLLKKQTILKPVLSEKSLNSYHNNKVCVFWVDIKSTKTDIAKNFKDHFGIEALVVRTVIQRKNSKVRTKQRNAEVRKLAKKAYINIGDNTLDIFENIK